MSSCITASTATEQETGSFGSGGATTSTIITPTTSAATVSRPRCGTTSLAPDQRDVPLDDHDRLRRRFDDANRALDPLYQRDVSTGDPGAYRDGAIPVAVPRPSGPRRSGAAAARLARRDRCANHRPLDAADPVAGRHHRRPGRHPSGTGG